MFVDRYIYFCKPVSIFLLSDDGQNRTIKETKSKTKKIVQAHPKDKAIPVSAKTKKILKKTSTTKSEVSAVSHKISATKPSKDVKRLTPTAKAINVQGIVKALKRKLKPSGGFTVESIPNAVESPEPNVVVSKNGFTVDDLDSDGSGNESDSFDSNCSCSCESQSGEENSNSDDECDEECDEEGEECDDSDCNCNCSCHSESDDQQSDDASVGSDAEEVVSNDDDDYMDWSDSDSAASDDSCPQLIPIDAELSDSDDSTYESESYSSYDDSYSSSDFSSADESCPELIPIDAELADSDDDTYESECSSDEQSYSSHDFSDIPYYDDPMFFETPRDPMIVSVATATWEPIPLIVNETSYHENDHDTTIQSIVDRATVSQPSDRKRSLNVSRVKFVDRLDSIPADAAETAVETIVQKQPEVIALSPVRAEVEESSSISPDTESPIDFDASNLEDSQYEPFDDTAAIVDFEPHFEPVEPDVTLTGAHRPHFYNSLNSRQVLLVLKSELHFHGILSVTLLAGNVRIYGYNLRVAQPVRVYSPRGQSFLSMTPAGAAAVPGSDDAPNAAPDLDDVHTLLADLQPDFLNSDIYEAIQCFDPAAGNALLLLEAADRLSPAFNMLDRYMRQAIFPNSAAFNAHRSLYSTEFILRTQFHNRPKTKLAINRQWLDVDAAVAGASNARTIVCGGKGVGKSTYVRYLVNRAVQRHGGALLIDLDIGQPELFVPQCIAATCVREPLLGAGYMQSRAPDRALLFGEINVTIAPLKYLRCVLRLLRECAANAEWAQLPWVVNTMGYNRGFGLEMMACVLRVFAMTDVVQIQSQRRLDNFEQILSADVVNGFPFKFFRQEVEAGGGGSDAAASRVATHRTHVLRSMARKFGDKTADWDMSAKDSRLAAVLANLAPALSDGSEWLTDVRPVW